ncbi:MAG: DEAD/DEAH box helicase, partial [Polyangiales bacterium]
RISPRADTGIELALCVRVFPLSPLWPPGEGAERVEGLVEGVQRFSRRELQRERELAELVVAQLGLGEYTEVARRVYLIESQAAALEVLSLAARLADRLDLEWAEPARRLLVSQTVRRGDLHVRLWKRGSWLTLSGGARVGESELAIGKLLDAVRRGERFVQVQGRDYVEIEQSLFSLLQDAQLSVRSRERELALALAAAPPLLAELPDAVSGGDAEASEWLERLAHAKQTAAYLQVPLEDQLRSYQRDGVRWMLALSEWAPGACLADEMGLGKTVQTIALLLARAARGPALVVAPTSLVSNWQAELERFAADGLRPLVYRGPERERLLTDLGPRCVLITSYEILLRDSERLLPIAFATQVVDEAQTVRNARTRRAQVVAEVQADFRVALTGTPIENRLGDLWSLSALVAPGLLGGWSRFRALFAVPIERYEDRERAARLRNMVAPFILRRTKDQVAPELPERTEVVHAIELSEPEQQLYAAALAHARKALGKRKKDREEREFTVHILAELTQLRQLACHPRLVLPDSRIESSKLHALLGLLDDLLPRGHRVLLFSQFTKHLGLVREALDARRVTSLYLDGSTPGGERAQLIAQFQSGAADVFLISLKAGGTGLNLTAADYVIHLDPWWNPAAEDQASDRAHRIGQTRPVTIVKLVSQGTIEERVLGLHEHKRRLAADMLTGESSDVSLDREALEALLED